MVRLEKMFKIIESSCRQLHPGLAAWHGGDRLQRGQGATVLGEKELLVGNCHRKDFAESEGRLEMGNRPARTGGHSSFLMQVQGNDMQD